MGKPAARIGDMHVCPMSDGPKPHVGGPILGPGVPTVLIGGIPAATAGDMCTCTGPPDSIMLGSIGVMIGGKPAARMGDICMHGGTIVAGLPTVLIGETMSGSVPGVSGYMGQAGKLLLNTIKNTPPRISEKIAHIASFEQAASKGSFYAAELKNFIDVVKLLSPFKEKQIEKDELQFRLLDQDGEPVSGENYKVTLPNGSIRTGKTNENGEVHIVGIDPGSCKVSFPDIHADDWS